MTVLALRRAEPHGARVILIALAMLSTVLYGALAQLTGGTASPLFRWSLGLPIIVALVLPGSARRRGRLRLHPGDLRPWRSSPGRASRRRRSARWAAQAVVVTSLAYTVSATYRRLRTRETRPPDAQEVAAARVRASEAAVGGARRVPGRRRPELRTPLTSMLLHIEAIERTLPAGAVPNATISSTAPIEEPCLRMPSR